MDKANLSTPSVLAQLPVFGTPPRRDRPRGGPAPAPALGCRGLRPGRPCDRPGAVSSPTLDPHHPRSSARPGSLWSGLSPMAAIPSAGRVGGAGSSAGSSPGTSPGRGLAGASPLRFELPSGVSTRWRNRATRLHSHWLSRDFFGAVCPLFARNLEKCRRNPVEGVGIQVTPVGILLGRRRSTRSMRQSRLGLPPTGRLFDN